MSTNKANGFTADYNINTNGTLEKDYASDGSNQYLDQHFTSLDNMFNYLDLGDGKDNNIITEETLSNLLYTASGKQYKTKFSQSQDGANKKIDSVAELKQALLYIELISQKDVFNLVSLSTTPPSTTPPSTTPPSSNVNNYNGLPITFTYTESGSDEDGGSTTHQNAIKLKEIFDAMYNTDPDFRTLIEAVKQKHGKFEIKVMPLNNAYGEAYVGEHRLWIDDDVLKNAITAPTGGSKTFDGGLVENNLQKLQGTIVHETLHVLGLEHDPENGNPGIEELEYVPFGTDNIFYDTLNGKDDRRSITEYQY
jgi:hypothetical protein